jgi:hypothetical protein
MVIAQASAGDSPGVDAPPALKGPTNRNAPLPGSVTSRAPSGRNSLKANGIAQGKSFQSEFLVSGFLFRAACLHMKCGIGRFRSCPAGKRHDPHQEAEASASGTPNGFPEPLC